MCGQIMCQFERHCILQYFVHVQDGIEFIEPQLISFGRCWLFMEFKFSYTITHTHSQRNTDGCARWLNSHNTMFDHVKYMYIRASYTRRKLARQTNYIYCMCKQADKNKRTIILSNNIITIMVSWFVVHSTELCCCLWLLFVSALRFQNKKKIRSITSQSHSSKCFKFSPKIYSKALDWK